jgi:hypothetical protein
LAGVRATREVKVKPFETGNVFDRREVSASAERIPPAAINFHVELGEAAKGEDAGRVVVRKARYGALVKVAARRAALRITRLEVWDRRPWQSRLDSRIRESRSVSGYQLCDEHGTGFHAHEEG